MSSGDISVEPVRGHKIEDYFVTDLDPRNDENRPGLTSGSVAEERQEVSSKNTIDEMADAITGGNDIGFWSANAAEKMRECRLKNKTGSLNIVVRSYFLTMMFHNTDKTERTEMHKSSSSPQPQRRSR